MARQPAEVSNSIEPGTPSMGRWLHSRAAEASCWPEVSKTTARVDPVPASMARRSGRPLNYNSLSFLV
jgi:hypothetical protein